MTRAAGGCEESRPFSISSLLAKEEASALNVPVKPAVVLVKS